MSREIGGKPAYWVASYFVDGLLIDTGCGYTAEELMSFLEKHPPKWVVNTHYHEDHIGANRLIQERFGIKIYAHRDSIPLIGRPASLFPYQELVYGCAAHPPVVQGKPLWAPLAATLPDLNNPYWRSPLDLKNFQYPYTKMDLPTPKPQHKDPTKKPSAADRLEVLGKPKLAVDRPIVLVNVRPGQSATPAEVRISNSGTGLVPWRVSANKSWVKVSQQAGVAVGSEMPCLQASACERTAVLKISVDPSKVIGSDAAVVRITGLGLGVGGQDVAVFIRVNVAIGIPGTAKN